MVSNRPQYRRRFVPWRQRERRLEDRIRELCALAVGARRDDERELILAEFRCALREQNQRLKKNAIRKLVEQVDGFQERRA